MSQYLDAIDAGHLDVGNDHIEQRAVDLALGQLATGDGFHFVPITAQGDVEQFADRAFVIADENVTHAPLLPQRQRRNRTRKNCHLSLPLDRGGATAPRNSTPCPPRNAPTPCPRAPARSDTRWRGRVLSHLQNSTGKVRRFFPS